MSKRAYYTKDIIIQALKTLELNDMNYCGTAKQLGINKNTIHKWAEELGPAVWGNNELQDNIIKRVNDEFVEESSKFVKKAWEVKHSLLEKIDELIPAETKLNTLAYVLDVVHKATNGDTRDLDKLQPTAGNIFMQINNKIESHGK